MGRDFLAFVHFRASDGRMAFQSDHAPRTPTSIWSGRVEYSYNVLVPATVPDGDYRVVVGLYDKKAADRGWDHPALEALDGAIAEKGQERATSCQVGILKVDAGAPLPELPAPALDLDGFVVTFDEEFDDLSVSAAGPGTRWFTATKENFGDARFVEQKDGFPFSVENGVLRIEASKAGGAWRSGILASVDPKGNGFSQRLGYFEMRAKFPASQGMWPAFWLLGRPSLTDKTRTNIEIDVVEWYGVMPNAMFGNMHLWHPDGRHWGQGDLFTAPGMTAGFHDYGVMIDEENVVWYFDGIEVFRQKTPEEAKVPLYLLVNLAMGGGWPIDRAVSPSYLYVDRVRVHARRS